MKNKTLSGFGLGTAAAMGILAFGLGTGTTGCGDDDGSADPGPFDLVFEGTGYSPHEGQTLHVTLYETLAGTTVDTGSDVVAGGVFGFTFSGALEVGKAYTLDFFADVDGDGACLAGTDHVWRVEIPSVTDDVTVSETHNTDFTAAACDSF